MYYKKLKSQVSLTMKILSKKIEELELIYHIIIGSDDIVEDIQLCDEGSIEAVNILLCEIAKLMQAYLSHSSASNGLHMVAACLSLIWGLTKHSEELTKVGIADNIAQSPELVNACCEMLKYYPGKLYIYIILNCIFTLLSAFRLSCVPFSSMAYTCY